jgi:outer membrane receptor protein involved in Fe transport
VAGYTSAGKGIYLPGYDTLDASGAYDFGHVKLKLAVFNLADKRSVTSFNGQVLYDPTFKDTGLYQLQSGRTVMGTLQAKF